MDRYSIIQSHVRDLKIGYELARSSKNAFLQKYVENQIESVKSNYSLSFLTDFDLVFSYSIDLALFIKISRIVGNASSDKYFFARLNDVLKEYPELKEKEEIKEVM